MALVQLLAAELAGILHVVFHTHLPAGSKAFDEATALLAELRADASCRTVCGAIDKVAAMGFSWGVSDGN